jgi:hypothetical protein
MRIYNPSLGKFLSVDPITAKYPELTPYQFASNSPIWMIDIDGLEGEPYSTMPYSKPSDRLGEQNTHWGWATSSSAGQADQQADRYGARISGVKYYTYTLPWITYYLWQKPIFTIVNATNVNNNVFPGAPVPQPPLTVARTIGFVPMVAGLSAAGVAQVNVVAALAQPIVNTQFTGPAVPQPITTAIVIDNEGLPITTTTQNIVQPIQQTIINSTISITMQTSLAIGDARAVPLLNARFANISMQLQGQGIPAANITMAALTPADFGINGVPNNSIFTITTTTTLANGTQTTTNTRVSDGTYEK